MKKAIDKFLMSDRVLYAMPWICAAAVIAWQITMYVTKPEMSSVFDLGINIINVLLIFGIAISYKTHEKNIMKTLFGAIMMSCIICKYYFVTFAFRNNDLIEDRIFAIISLCFYTLLFVNHLVLGYGHKSNLARIEMNRIVALILIAVEIIWNTTLVDFIPVCILCVIYNASILIEILCIETKVDAYKIIRESNNRCS